ncbi:DUF1330 domain-containing protein [Rhodococcus sp. HNM0563]|uniref:DUF1330 domain-containing protein n=1 Tax=unclassified Rhodococcus (in: high G+C Gram-positive bacteria) TaxID=192944 RepID=UPI001469B922|nr:MULTISPECIES: DUF1330 domain-containing protein [unclassified Rhodococcus (in: high G+C Gram-positive bacteria)]MCK0089839.1 DUF1330 domain-containing protein [Rhodococcus sp. F64268]NLU62212.1 DUF1330 domain-containing protein [Rhodococcus sp. HNM0563]
MTAYAIAHLSSVDFGADIIRYLEKIDDTFAPYGGRFLVHGVDPEVLEGPFPGFVIVIEFPDIARARGWYDSPGYQEILPLRTENSDGVAVLVEGTADGYRATDYLVKVTGRA